MQSRNSQLGPDGGARLLGWIGAAWIAAFLAMLVLVPRCHGAEVPLKWTDPALDGDGTPLRDGVGTFLECSKNGGAWEYLFGTARPLTPGAPNSRTLILSGGVWRVRVVAYDDAGLQSRSASEVWLFIMFNRVWGKWINET